MISSKKIYVLVTRQGMLTLKMKNKYNFSGTKIQCI